MNRNRIPILLLLLAASFYSAHAADDCLALFKKAYDKMFALYTHTDHDKGISMRYHIEVTNAENESYSDVVEVKSNKQKSLFISGKVTIYQDAAAMVAIQPEAKTIFLTRPLPVDFHKDQMNSALKMHDSLFQYLVLKNCTKDVLEKEKQACKKLSFEVTPANQKKIGMTGITYWINEKEVRVLKLKIDYAEHAGKPLKSASYLLDNFNGTFSGLPFEGSAAGMVMSADKKLKPVFKGYTLIDKR